MAKKNEMVVNIGINDKDRKKIAEGLSKLLADTYTLYLKTHNFHWNVTGPMFNTLHTMFETQYTELALAVDSIAERIRALGYPAPGTYAEYARLVVDQGRGRRARRQRYDPQAGGRAGSRGAHRALAVPGDRRRRRRAVRRPADPAHADARKDRLDAALAAGLIR